MHLTINSTLVKMGAAVISDQQWKRMFGIAVALEQETHYKDTLNIKLSTSYGTGHRKSQLPLLVVVGNQRSSLFGHTWLLISQLDWVVLYHLQENALSSIISLFPVVFNKDVGKRILDNHSPETVNFKKSQSVAYALHPTLEVELNRM